MPKMIRNVQKPELIRLCKAFLRENRLRVPCDTTFHFYLNELQAATAKQMCGINPSQEECMSSFPVLIEITSRLKVFGLTNDASKLIIESINTIHCYVKSHFHYNLEMQSSIASHCVTFGVSDSSHVLGNKCKPHTEVRLSHLGIKLIIDSIYLCIL